MIGIYGGTFDPVHFGHLRTALEIREIFAAAEIRLVPSARPPHREQPAVSAAMRVEMLHAALNGHPGLVVDTRELDRAGPSYMVDTLASIRSEVGAEEPLLLCIGCDAFLQLESWHRWRQLFDHAHIVVITRPGWRHEALVPFYQGRMADAVETLQTTACGRLLFQQVTRLEISATRIREILAEGKDPSFLLPDAVLAIIAEHRLYT